MGERRFIPIKEFIELAPFGRNRCYELAKTAGFGIRDRSKWVIDLHRYERFMEAHTEGNAQWDTSGSERRAETTRPSGPTSTGSANAGRRSPTTPSRRAPDSESLNVMKAFGVRPRSPSLELVRTPEKSSSTKRTPNSGGGGAPKL